MRGAISVAVAVDAAFGEPLSSIHRARELLSWHLVSRDTSRLSPSGVAAAAIESLADCTSFGLPDRIRVAARQPAANDDLLSVMAELSPLLLT